MRIILLLLALTTQAFAGNSQENRKSLDYQATMGLGNLELASGYGLSLSKFLDENSLLGVTAKVGIQSDVDDDRDQRETNFDVHFKRFLGNSFYLNPKLYYLNWNDPRENLPERSLTSIGAGVSLGNQWQWERFTVGADWLSISKNLIYFKREEVRASWYITSLYFYLGWSWN